MVFFYKYKMLLVAAILVAVCGNVFAELSDRMLEAYGRLDFKEARQLAGVEPEIPLSRLITGLCDIHDEESRNYTSGLTLLRGLYEYRSLRKDIWLQAAIAYARTAQLLQMRSDLYDYAQGIDVKEIYKDIIEVAPDSREACMALAFACIGDFESRDIEHCRKAFDELEKFCRNYNGSPAFLVPVHLLADFEYITLENNYKNAVEHLVAAYKLGISTQHLNEISLFRIARIYQTKLNNTDEAEKYFNLFLKQFPHSGYEAVVKECLAQIKDKKRNK